MKRFTVKDFILYNGPCFSCGNKVNVNLVYININQFTKLPQSIKKSIIDVTLKIKYSFSLDLQISISDNKYKVSDIEKFITYLGIHELHLVSRCSHCQNLIYSNTLQFDSKGFIRPITILREVLSIESDNVFYSVMSEYAENMTYINVLNQDTNKMMKLDIPLVPLYKFKTKEKLLKKLKTYILFS